MLRLLKKYTFGYHVLPILKTSAPIPSRSIIMSSYPGALSSHDEFYWIQGENREMIIAGTPMTDTNSSLWNFMKAKNQVNKTFYILLSIILTDCRYTCISKDIYIKQLMI